MTTYAIPSWWRVANFEAMLVPQVRTFSSPYGGAGQALDLLGERWEFGVELPGCSRSAAARQEAFFNALRGPAHLLSLYHFARPQPQGTARGSFTLSATMAQGASTMALAGLLAPPNLIKGGGFEVDGNFDNLADGWVLYTSGSVTGGVAEALVTGNGSPKAQRIYAAVLGPMSSDQLGVLYGAYVPVSVGVDYSFSVDVRSTSGGDATVRIVVVWLNASLGVVSSSPQEQPTSVAWVRRTVSAQAPATAAYAQLYVWMQGDSVGAPIAMELDNAQFEAGALATAFAGSPTLLAGDMLGHNSEQLFQVLEDATANDAGAVTVTLANRSRKAIASGQAINWNKPTATFRLADGAGVPRVYAVGDYSPGLGLRFVETWA